MIAVFANRNVRRGNSTGYRTGIEKWLELNREYADKWPNITSKKPQPEDADTFRDEKGKYEKYFSAEPGEGD